MPVSASAVLASPALALLYALLVINLAVLITVNVYTAVALFWFRLASKRIDRIDASPVWPRITLLVPAYHEERCLLPCVRALANIAYPRDALEIILLTEFDDTPTTRIARELVERAPGELIIKNVVVHQTTEPRGKPRALNEGLRYATGDVIGVIDAEDVVNPRLCATVASEMAHHHLDAVQGVLDMANDYDGWLNLHFRAEYGYWFNIHLPSIAEAGYPMPFGGTTNFMTRDALERIGGWNACNLTEDFELGMRAFASGLRVGTIGCRTREESPTSFSGWLRQRTRWQRGKLQTLLHLRRLRPHGAFEKWHIVLTCLAARVPALNMSAILISLYIRQTGGVLPALYWLLAFGAFMWSVGLCGLHAYGYLFATRDEVVPRRRARAFVCGVTLPLYWLAQWIAEIRCLRQEFLEGTLFWEKTEHGLRHVIAARSVRQRSDWVATTELLGK